MSDLNLARISNLDQFDGQTVTLRGWVFNKRSSGKIKFLMIRDGSGIVQGVLVKGECDDQSFEEFEKIFLSSLDNSLMKKQRQFNLGF